MNNFIKLSFFAVACPALILPDTSFAAKRHKVVDLPYVGTRYSLQEARSSNYELGMAITTLGWYIIDWAKVQIKINGSSKDYKTFMAHTKNYDEGDEGKAIMFEFDWSDLAIFLDKTEEELAAKTVNIKIKIKSVGAGNGNQDGWKEIQVRRQGNVTEGTLQIRKGTSGSWTDVIDKSGYYWRSEGAVNNVKLKYRNYYDSNNY